MEVGGGDKGARAAIKVEAGDVTTREPSESISLLKNACDKDETKIKRRNRTDEDINDVDTLTRALLHRAQKLRGE